MQRLAVRSLLLLLCGTPLAASAWHAASVHRPAALSRRAAHAGPAMVAAEPLAAQLAVPPLAGAELPLPSLLLGEGLFDLLAGLAGTPLILLIPIGAGSLVAFGIIFILVKSAEPGKPSS